MAILTLPAAKGAKPDYTGHGEWRNGIPRFHRGREIKQ